MVESREEVDSLAKDVDERLHVSDKKAVKPPPEAPRELTAI